MAKEKKYTREEVLTMIDQVGKIAYEKGNYDSSHLKCVRRSAKTVIETLLPVYDLLIPEEIRTGITVFSKADLEKICK